MPHRPLLFFFHVHTAGQAAYDAQKAWEKALYDEAVKQHPEIAQ